MTLLRVALATILLGFQVRQEVQLRWDLPHDRAAIYQVVDSSTAAPLREFFLLGCELDGRIDALNSSDIPLRYVFRIPKEPVKPLVPWNIKERIFTQYPGALAPLEVVGVCQVRGPKSIRVDELFRASAKTRKEKAAPVEVFVVEGQYQVYRGNWVNGAPGTFEQTPSTTFTTLATLRASDNAILGVSYQWLGRSEDYVGNYSSASVSKRTIARELTFRDQCVDLNKVALKERIDLAVQRGVKWLHTCQATDGKFTEPILLSDKWSYAKEFLTSLSLMALLHSGVSPDHKSIKAGFAYLDSRRLTQTWDIGLCLLALESKYLPLGFYEDILTYSEDKAREKIAQSITAADRSKVEQLAHLLMGYQGRSGGFGYSDPTIENIQTTQYALLGLKSASRMGVSIPASVWLAAIRYLESSIESAGVGLQIGVSYLDGRKPIESSHPEYGWTYTPHTDGSRPKKQYLNTNGTRVMSALAAVAICRSELSRSKAIDKEVSRRLDDLELGGLAWWTKNPGLRAPQHEGCIETAALHYFYLWSTERAATFLGVERINGHPWYYEGAAHILSAQCADGNWDGLRGVPIADTACALLFLKRATIPVATPGKEGSYMEPSDAHRPTSTERK